jgi:predicted ATPase
LLLFDDLHWVDEGTAAFLLHLGRELTGSRLMVLGAYRSATVALGRRDSRSGEMARHPLAIALDELRRVKGDIVVELDQSDGRAFVEDYVDTEPNRLGARFRDALYAQTGGHALFTVETLRNLQARGALYKDEAGRWVSRDSLDWGGLPARVEAAIAERIERLPEAGRRLLSAASVQGDSFAAEVVAEVTGEAGARRGCTGASLRGRAAPAEGRASAGARRPGRIGGGVRVLPAGAGPRAGKGRARVGTARGDERGAAARPCVHGGPRSGGR